MNERPILFSAPMVRALLTGTKTQTRRIVKPSNSLVDGWPASKLIWNQLSLEGAWIDPGPSPAGNPGPYLKAPSCCEQQVHRVYSRYQTIDRLWVRETHCAFEVGHVHYAADFTRDPKGEREHGVRWTPSIHMPRWASRITLEITDVRVERLQEISEADAIAEGAPQSHYIIDAIAREHGYEDFSRSWYAQLWERINGPISWAANPWVWVIAFRRIFP